MSDKLPFWPLVRGVGVPDTVIDALNNLHGRLEKLEGQKSTGNGVPVASVSIISPQCCECGGIMFAEPQLFHDVVKTGYQVIMCVHHCCSRFKVRLRMPIVVHNLIEDD